MIGVKPQGRLGNQMFQYAFAYAQAKKLDTTFFVEKKYISANNYSLFKYFKLRKYEIYNLYISKLRYKFLSKIGVKYNDKIESGMFEPKDVLQRVADNDYWIGYFQTDAYFEEETENIKDLFSLKNKYIKEFKNKYEEIFSVKKNLVIHVRRTDYVNWGSDSLGGINLTLPIDYYHDCIAKIKNLDDYNIIVLSDDLEFCKEKFKNYPSFNYESNSEIVDFQIMLNADKLIISNSTFAWWAAYLNNKPNLKTFAPKYWIGFKIGEEVPRGVMTKKFEWIDTTYKPNK